MKIKKVSEIVRGNHPRQKFRVTKFYFGGCLVAEHGRQIAPKMGIPYYRAEYRFKVGNSVFRDHQAVEAGKLALQENRTLEVWNTQKGTYTAANWAREMWFHPFYGKKMYRRGA